MKANVNRKLAEESDPSQLHVTGVDADAIHQLRVYAVSNRMSRAEALARVIRAGIEALERQR